MVTAYHVVWPYEEAWVVFPDGTELQNVPVVQWDPLSDLAVLGPVNVSAPPLKLEDGEDAAIGEELFFVGYPSEYELFPEPSITRGILSRFREWDRLGLTYLQTDAAIAGGQSGGALINPRGQVVGISSYLFGEFGLATSASDVAQIVERLIGEADPSTTLGRRLPTGLGAFEFEVEISNNLDSHTFVFDGRAGTILEFWVDGPGDAVFWISDPTGLLLSVDDAYTGVEYGAIEILTDGIHFLQVALTGGKTSDFTVGSTIRLRAFNDPDDGRTVAVGDTVIGSIDSPLEWDWYLVQLDEGETVRISTDSATVDTLVYVDFPDSRLNQLVSDDDSGGGIFGTNSELVYRAPHTGQYIVAVDDAVDQSVGGYYLTIEEAPVGSETVQVPPSPEMVDSPYGRMIVFEDPWDYFRVQVPAAWAEYVTDPEYSEIFYAFDPDSSGSVSIIQEDTTSLGQLSLEEYADLVEFNSIDSGGRVIAREQVRTSQGLPAIRTEVLFTDTLWTRLIYHSNDGVGFIVSYAFPRHEFDANRGLADHSFGTLLVN